MGTTIICCGLQGLGLSGFWVQGLGSRGKMGESNGKEHEE